MQFCVLIGLSLLLLLFDYAEGLEFDVPSADRCPPNFVHDEETDACTKKFDGTFDGTLTWLDNTLTQLREEKTKLEKLEKLENEESQLQFEDDLHDTKFTARNGVRGRKPLVTKKRRRRNELEVKLKVSILELQIGQVLLERDNHVLRRRDEIPIPFDNKLEGLEHFKKIFGERNGALTKQIQELIDDRTALNSQLTIMTEKTEEQNVMIKQLEEAIISLLTIGQEKKTYHLFKTKVDFRGALRSCREKHMNLATIRSKEDNDAFTELLESEGVNKMESVWIGGTTQKRFDKEWQIGWFWISDGELLDYTNWEEGQPDNYKSYGPESCLSYWRRHGTRSQWEWNDMSCDAILIYGCESFDPY